jgi:hypothetical protein
MSNMTIREELHQLVDGLPEEDAAEALDYVRWLIAETDELTPGELAAVEAAEARMARREYTTLSDLRHQLGGS